MSAEAAPPGQGAAGPGAVLVLRVERVRRVVDAVAWVAIGLGIAFTTVNVQVFAADGAAAGSLGWLVAWLLDPIPSLLLIAILLAEQVTARWQVALGGWVGFTKWVTFVATAAMNTWGAWAAGSAAEVLKHSVPPVMVFLGAQVAPVLRDGLTGAVATAIAASAGHLPGAVGAGHTAGPAAEPGSGPGTAAPDQDPVPSAGARGQSAARGAGGQPAPTAPGIGRGDVAVTGGRGSAEDDMAAGGGGGGGCGAGAGAGGGADPRVVVLAELLAAGADVTGPQAGVLVARLAGEDVSHRTARRLLSEAKTHTLTADVPRAGDSTRPGLGPGGGAGLTQLQLIRTPGEESS